MVNLGEPRRVNILGHGVHALTLPQAVSHIETWIAQHDSPRYICCADVNVVMHGRRDPSLRRLYNRASLLTPDGMPLVWWCRVYGESHTARVYGPDLMLALCGRGYRHFFYGTTDSTLAKLAAHLQQRYPQLAIAGIYAPPFRDLTPEEDASIITTINACYADIIWIGLGSPKQDRWMAAHLDRLNTPVLIGVGAAFDFIAGVKPQAPIWMRRRSLEWFFRLASEPRRLWRRYAQNIPTFIILSLLQRFRLRRFPIDE